MCRVLVNEKSLDINDVGIGALAMQGSNNFRKNNFSNFLSSSNIIQSDGQNPLTNSKMNSQFMLSDNDPES